VAQLEVIDFDQSVKEIEALSTEGSARATP